MADSFTLNIMRFDPTADTEPHLATYEVPDDPEFAPMTVLKALHYINDHIEPIGYDFNCRRGTCGRCAVMVDGVACLACEKEVTGEHTVEPLDGFPVVRDLIVDKAQGYARFLQAGTAIRTLKADGVLQPIDGDKWRDVIYPLNACRECMCCYASCSALAAGDGHYAGPGALQTVYLRSIDEEDRSNRIEQATFMGLFNCIQCGNCTAVCPAGIPCAENIRDMMDQAEKAGLKPEGEPTAWWPML